jgi:outer membrane protein
VGAGDVLVNGNVSIPQPTRYFATSSASLGVRQLLYNGGRWESDVAASGLARSSSEESVAEQRLQTTFLVEQRFFELARAQRQLAVLTETAGRSGEQTEIAQKLFDAGRASQADVYAARANHDNDEINRLGQASRVTLAQLDLAVAIGLDGMAPAIVEPPQLLADPAEPPLAEEAMQTAITKRPVIKALQLAADAQRRHADGAGSDNLPVVAVSGNYGRSTTGLDTFTESPDRNSQLTAGVGLSWNLFSGYATRAQVDKAQLAVLQAENDLAGARRTVAADVQKAIAQLATVGQQARIALQAETNAREALRLAKLKQELGTGTQLEVRDAELRLTQSQLARVAALVDGREAEAALRRATGSPHE